MSKWIVFITVSHVHVTSVAEERSEHGASTATYPLLAAPSKAMAERVVARLEHQHGSAVNAERNVRREFSYRAETELTPHELAVTLDLRDSEYPKNGRSPSWLSEMVTAAKTAMADLLEHALGSSPPSDPTYLFIGPGAAATPSTVFHLARTRATAEVLCTLFAKEYATTGACTFGLQAADDLPPHEHLLLDEAISELALYDDPDPGVYDPPASKTVLLRAEYARSADRWEAMIEARDRSGLPSGGVTTKDQILVLIAETGVHFGDTSRVLPLSGAVVAAISGRALAEAVADLYRVDRGDDALPLVLVERSTLSVTQFTLAMRELARAESIGSSLGCEDYSTRDPTVARIGICALDLARLAAELRPVVEQRELKSGSATGRSSAPSPALQLVNNLLNAIEHHRLWFLFWGRACSGNPMALRNRPWLNDRVSREEIRGWTEMVEASESDGKFLWNHRDVLERYAKEAMGRFGPGAGQTPSVADAKVTDLSGESTKRTFWSIDDGSHWYMERSSDAILSSCRALTETGPGGPAIELVKDASAAARPGGFAAWHTDVVVPWSYLSTLDSLISRIKSLCVDLATPTRAETSAGGTSEVTRPDPETVADLVVLFMVMRDLLLVARDYPDAMPEVDHKAWITELFLHAKLKLSLPGLEPVRELMNAPELLEMDVPYRFGSLMSASLMAHPGMAKPADSDASIRKLVETTHSTCQTTASPSVQAQRSRLAKLMVESCRCPTGTAVKDFAEPARALQMLNRYWRLASALVWPESPPMVEFFPHPLLHVIENIRDRLQSCFRQLGHLSDAQEAALACDQLLRTLTEGELFELSEAPGRVSREVRKVERFIARNRMKIGGREYALTGPEEFFLNSCNQLIADHRKREKKAWKQVVEDAKANSGTMIKAGGGGSDPDSSSHPPAPRMSDDVAASLEEMKGRSTRSRDEVLALLEVRGLAVPTAPEAAVLAANTETINLAAAAAAEKALASMEARNKNGVGGTGTDWKSVQGKLLAKRDRGELFTTGRALAREMGCEERTIRKAIAKTVGLKAWKNLSKGAKSAPKATDLGAADRERTQQTTEPSPSDVLPEDDVETAMNLLIQNAKPKERARLNALNDDERRSLVATLNEQNLDQELSPLEPDKPGKRPRTVKQHKLA